MSPEQTERIYCRHKDCPDETHPPGSNFCPNTGKSLKRLSKKAFVIPCLLIFFVFALVLIGRNIPNTLLPRRDTPSYHSNRYSGFKSPYGAKKSRFPKQYEGDKTSRFRKQYEAEVSTAVRTYSKVIKPRGTNALDSSVWQKALINPALEKQKRSTCWLRDNKLRFVYDDQNISVVDVKFRQDFRYATVVARISETRGKMRFNGTYQKKKSYSSYRAVYELKRIGGKWYIYCLQSLKEGDPIRCKISLDDTVPCRR